MSQIVDREYDSRELAIKTLSEIAKMMVQAGNSEAALELSKSLVEKKLDPAFIRELLAFRAQHASAGFIELKATSGPDHEKFSL
jgi:hypothetical protein